MDGNMGVAMELKVMAGLETETAGAMEKSKVMAGSEVEMVVGMESGVDMEVGTDSKSKVGMSGNIGGCRSGHGKCDGERRWVQS